MKIELKYFASIREEIGKQSEQIEWRSGTAEDLLSHIENKYERKFNYKHLKVAINDEYVPLSAELKDGDSVTFIPPVAGG